jgi:hypothetical protein
VRILVAAPPKTGNMWAKCLLGSIYGLRWLKPKEQPRQSTLQHFRAWVAEGNFADGTIYHQHYDFCPEICDIAEGLPAHVVTLVRDPYDAFVSTYHTLQQHHAEDNRKKRKMVELMGKPLDDPSVIEFLKVGGYRNNLIKARDWMTCGRVIVIRYEELHADPVGALTRATEQIAPVDRSAIEAAVAACTPEAMRQRSAGMERHVREARPGDAKQKLTPAHYEAFREAYSDLIEQLGYEVR